MQIPTSLSHRGFFYYLYRFVVSYSFSDLNLLEAPCQTTVAGARLQFLPIQRKVPFSAFNLYYQDSVIRFFQVLKCTFLELKQSFQSLLKSLASVKGTFFLFKKRLIVILLFARYERFCKEAISYKYKINTTFGNTGVQFK